MKAIWKFPIGTVDRVTVMMPQGSMVLCVQVQADVPCVWARVDINAPSSPHVFCTYGTGHQHASISDNYIGTYQLAGGALVFHVFEETP